MGNSLNYLNQYPHPCQFTTKAGSNHNHELQMGNSLNYLNQYPPSPNFFFWVISSFPLLRKHCMVVQQHCLPLLGDTWRWHKIMLSLSNWVVSVIVKFYIFQLWRQSATDINCDVRARDCFGTSDWCFSKHLTHNSAEWGTHILKHVRKFYSLLLPTVIQICTHNIASCAACNI